MHLEHPSAPHFSTPYFKNNMGVVCTYVAGGPLLRDIQYEIRHTIILSAFVQKYSVTHYIIDKTSYFHSKI
jgi:hypothetical protein